MVHISNKDYLTCKKNWNKFNMKNMGDYYDHYLKKDVLLLANVFKKFIDTCLKFYKLDPDHYFSSPEISWDLMLKMTGAELEKNSNVETHLFLEKGLRREITYIAKRYSKANNKYMSNYDPTKPSIQIPYLDMNNLPGCGISDYLPYGGFKRLKSVNSFGVNTISEKSPIGYIFQDRLKYPDKLHVLHNDYPLFPEKLGILYDMLSDYCKKLLRNMD